MIKCIYEFSCYSYDTRNLKSSINVHKDHVSAVTSIDYAPTGLEFVTGSYDKTVRIFESHKVFFKFTLFIIQNVNFYVYLMF